MSVKPQLAEAGESQLAAASRSATADLDSFVINLCSSTTPMALAHPDTPELKRFKFFVSRRLEDGRERFRLHMGHFQSLEEAEDWLSVVRDVYPGAWAGEAPGKRLRARAAASAQPTAPAPHSTAPEASAAHLKLPPVAAVPAAARPAAAAPAVAVPQIAPPLPAAARAPQAAPAAPAARSTPPPKVSVAAPAAARAPVPTLTRADALATKRPAARRAPVAPLSNVREVMASLDEGDAKSSKAPAARTAPSPAHGLQSLTDTQVMQILEARRTVTSPPPAVAREVPDGIAMLRPDDSGTRRALKDAVRDNAAVSFAVQLQWAAEPLALEKVPALAIFSAYTLYTVEGTREGRTWYGLRLGFFSDASTAKQVAHYVRSEFAAVAVVPVSQGERDGAVRKDRTTCAASIPHAQPAALTEEIPLFDAHGSEPPRVSLNDRGSSANTGSAAARAAAARSKKLRAESAVAEIVKADHTLEETLEILGAGELEIDNGRREFINQSGLHRQLEVRKNSPFQRLLARLTERVRKG